MLCQRSSLPSLITRTPRAPRGLIFTLLCSVLFCACASPRSQEALNSARAGAVASEVEVDAALQQAAAEALGEREGTVIVMDPRNGRLRAVVNPRLAFEQTFPPGSA